MKLPKASSPAMRNVFTMKIPGEREGIALDVVPGWTAATHGQIVPAQLCEPCTSVEPMKCLNAATGEESESSCVQRCTAGMGEQEVTFIFCCDPENCQQPQDCCKQVCCEVKVV